MMTNEDKKLIIDLSDKLKLQAFKFMEANIEDGRDMDDVLNIALSAHITSLANTLTLLVGKENIHIVKKTLDALNKGLSELGEISMGYQ